MMTYWIQAALLFLGSAILGLVVGRMLRGMLCRPVKYIDYGRKVEKDVTYKEPNYGLPKKVDGEVRKPHLGAAVGGAALGAAGVAGAVKLSESEVDVNLPDIDLPEVPTDVPDVDIKVPDIDVTTPEVDLDIQAPDVSMPKADLGVHASDIDVKAPEVDLPEPGFPGAKFSGFMKDPEIDADMSSLDVDLPKTSIDVSDVDVKTPDVDVDLPPASIDVPEVGIKAPDIDLPSASTDVPDVDVKTPDVDVDLPPVSIDVPEVDIKAPDVDVDLPLASIDVPDVDIKTPDLDADLSASVSDVEADGFNVSDMAKGIAATVATGVAGKVGMDAFSNKAETEADAPDVHVDKPESKLSAAEVEWPEVNVLSDDGEKTGVIGGAAVAGAAVISGVQDDDTDGNRASRSMLDLIRNEMRSDSAVRIKVLELEGCVCDELELGAENEITLMVGGKGKLGTIPCGVEAGELVMVDGRRSSIGNGQIALFLDANVVVCRQGEDYTFARL